MVVVPVVGGTRVVGMGVRCGPRWYPVVRVRVIPTTAFPTVTSTVATVPPSVHHCGHCTTLCTPLRPHCTRCAGYCTPLWHPLYRLLYSTVAPTDSTVATTDSTVASLDSTVASLAARLGLNPWRFSRSKESVSLRLWVRHSEKTLKHPEMT